MSTVHRAHSRSPSAAGLLLHTSAAPVSFLHAAPHPSSAPPLLHHHHYHHPLHLLPLSDSFVSVPVAIDDHFLAPDAPFADSMAGSLSPGSALSSPALNALADITPLPSPLIVADSPPGPWGRAGAAAAAAAAAAPHPGSRGSTSSSSLAAGAGGREESLQPSSASSASPSKKKKPFHGLMPAMAHNSAVHGHSRHRSLSEYVPEPMHNVRPRNATLTSVIPEEGHGPIPESHLQREAYLAARRGLTHHHHQSSSASSASMQMLPLPAPAAIPTPPSSDRSVAESEGEEGKDDDSQGVEYFSMRYGREKKRRLWRPIRQLGQGTFSKVILATCEKLNARDPLDEDTLDPKKLVAIKIVEHGPAGGADEERVELSLKREVEMLRSISHPSLVHLRAFDCDDAQAFLALSYCPGGDLFDLASERRDLLGPRTVQRMFSELVGAVRYLHSHQIVHRDIKLENVLVNLPLSQLASLENPFTYEYPIITLTDLGLSRRIPQPPASPLLTTRCGSEDYAAPEILLGQPYDGRSTDAWALGVLLYALMEGRLPFDPPPGKVGSRSRAAHRIARCEWCWWRFGDEDGEWNGKQGQGWEGAREVVESLLKKVSRGRKSVEDIEKMQWIVDGIQAEGGLKFRPIDLEVEEDEDDDGEEEEEAVAITISAAPEEVDTTAER